MDMGVTGEGKLTLEGKLIWSDGSHEPVELGVLASSDPEDGTGAVTVADIPAPTEC